MYHFYETSAQGKKTRYVHREETHLFGCIRGLIPKLLARENLPQQSEALKWHLPIQSSLQKLDMPHTSVIIDVKPRNTKPAYVSLYELIDVWGYSVPEWTPILLGLRGLLVDESPSKYNKLDFSVEVEDQYQPIFSILYLSGTITQGKIDGKWTPPGASPTNATLLWPEVFDYFYECKQETMKNVRPHGA